MITGLPVDQYHRNGALKQDLIEKIDSLAQLVARIGKGVMRALIDGQILASEATALFYDVLIQHDREYDAGIKALIARRPVAIMDLHGKTIDLIVAAENVTAAYKDQSGTKEIGMLLLFKQVVKQIKFKFTLNDNPPLPNVEEAYRMKKIRAVR